MVGHAGHKPARVERRIGPGGVDSLLEREYDAFFALFEEGFEWIVSDGSTYGGRYRGREEVTEGVFRRIRAELATFTHELDRLIDGGDGAVAIGRDEGTYGTTGTDGTAPKVHVFEIDAGTIERCQQFTDTAMFQAALPPDERTVVE